MAVRGGCGGQPPCVASELMQRLSLKSPAERLALPACFAGVGMCRAAAAQQGRSIGGAGRDKGAISPGLTAGKKQGFAAGKGKPRKISEEENAAAEAALEALFQQLEKDLEDDVDIDADADEELTPEELEELERELGEALSDITDLDDRLDFDVVPRDQGGNGKGGKRKRSGVASATLSDQAAAGDEGRGQPTVGRVAKAKEESSEEEDENETGSGDEDDIAAMLQEAQEPRVVNLERWQLKKLAAAVELGRRHVNVKALAGDTGLDRMDVLAFLKNPSPELLAELAMEPEEGVEEESSRERRNPGNNLPSVPSRSKSNPTTAQRRKATKPAAQLPYFTTPRDWCNNKRLRKEQIATFERVYQRSKHPSNAMIDNMVQLTHVPRRKIIQWFDMRRAQGEKDVDSFEPVPEEV